MEMNKSIMYADSGDHRSRNRGLRIKKNWIKPAGFLSKIY